MAWSTPMTFSAGAVLTAAQLNTHLRDNLNETAAATAAAAGDFVYADASHSMGSKLSHPGTSYFLVSAASNAYAARQPVEDINMTDGTQGGVPTSTSYSATDSLGKTFPTVTVTTGTLAIVMISCFRMYNDTAGARTQLSFSVSGATTTAASDTNGAILLSTAATDQTGVSAVRLATLTAGSNAFQFEARVSSGTGSIDRPRILVIPL